jgi:hypothetical protein
METSQAPGPRFETGSCSSHITSDDRTVHELERRPQGAGLPNFRYYAGSFLDGGSEES